MDPELELLPNVARKYSKELIRPASTQSEAKHNLLTVRASHHWKADNWGVCRIEGAGWSYSSYMIWTPSLRMLLVEKTGPLAPLA